MHIKKQYILASLLVFITLFFTFATTYAAQSDITSELIKNSTIGSVKPVEISTAIKVVILLTILSLIPTLLIATTSFLRIIIVLSMLRHAIGMQDTPPNAVLVSIAIFLTLFSMQPVWNKVNENAWTPFQANKISMQVALDEGIKPLRDFMIRQTREQDLALMVDLAGGKQPNTIDDIEITKLVPAFMLSELKSAFQIGFMIFLPFLLIDLVVASILTSLGMMMVPPVTISLPLKILMFILIDGWNLVVKSLMSSFS
jgi:flagellar biosynthetic protein FliP